MSGFHKIRVLSLLYVLFLLVSCGGKPHLEIDGTDEGESGLVTIAYLKSLYNSSPVKIKGDLQIQGRVVSNDRYGNFYKTICVEDASGGVAVRVDDTQLFKTYRVGAHIKIDCNTLTLGAYGGLLQLGDASRDGSYQTDPIPQDVAVSHIHIVAEAEKEPMPKTLSIDGVEPRYLSCFVEIRDVWFEEADGTLAWCDPDSDTDRVLTDGNGGRLIVRTSRYAEYAGWVLPAGVGNIRGVLSYFNGSYQLVMNDPYEFVPMD